MTPEFFSQKLTLLREKNPIVHSVTNYVAMQANANILLALGASPIMAHEESELAEITQISNALVINIGTLDKNWIEAMTMAQTYALQKPIPVILDPVGAGASKLRTRIALEFLQRGVQIIRGNASEIMALVDTTVMTKGVDSTTRSEAAIQSAQYLAKTYQCVVVISGEVDIITDGESICKIHNGTPIFTKVTAMGCSASAVVGAFSAVNSNYFDAAICAMTTFTLAGEKAAKKSQGPGTFSLHLLDELASLTGSDFNLAKVYPS